MALSNGWFVKMMAISGLVKEFEQGAEHCPYMMLHFHNGDFDHGCIDYSSGEVFGVLDFETLDELESTIRKLLEQQATSNLPGTAAHLLSGAA